MSETIFTVTESAANQLKEALEQSDLDSVRIVCVGVSCSGPQYQMGFDEVQEKDHVYELAEGGSLVVGPDTLEVLKGTTIDFTKNRLGQSGFTFTNPNVGGGCSSCPAKGCGSREEDNE